MSELKLLYQDEHIVAIDKPSGLVVHPSPEAPSRRTCLRLLRQRLDRLVYPVSRLDRGTSGVLVMGLSSEAASALAGAFRERLVDKTYLALVRGWIDESGVIDSPVDDKPALTSYRRLCQMEVDLPSPPHPTSRYSLVEAHPKTGLYHQIRRHLRRQGHPIIGDAQHGSKPHNRIFQGRFKIKRLLLHAYRLVLPHPSTGETLEIVAPLAGRMVGLLLTLGAPEELVRSYYR